MAFERTCVIYNPSAGRGQTRRELRRARANAARDFAYRPTARAGGGEELARRAVEEGFTRVIAAGGDGTVHEVANGVLRAESPGAVFSVWPIGSANDYAFALGLTEWWRPGNRHLPRTIQRVDVGRVREPGGRERYFVNGLGLGFNGAVTLESRRIRGLRGLPLYAWATLRALRRHFVAPPMRIAFEGAAGETPAPPVLEGPTFALTVNLGKREGNFPLTPEASLTDGLFDCIRLDRIARLELLRLLPGLAAGNVPADNPHFDLRRCRAVTVASEEPLRVHLDGEFFCQPEDGVRELEIELLPARLRVETFP